MDNQDKKLKKLNKIIDMIDVEGEYAKAEEVAVVLVNIVQTMADMKDEILLKMAQDKDYLEDKKIGTLLRKVLQVESSADDKVRKIQGVIGGDIKGAKSSIYAELSELRQMILDLPEPYYVDEEDLINRSVEKAKNTILPLIPLIPDNQKLIHDVEDLKKQNERLNDIERIAKMNSMPATTTYINGKRAKNIDISGATVVVRGDTAYVSNLSGTSLTITEVDGSPSGTPSTLKFPNGSLTDNGDGSFTFAPAGTGDFVGPSSATDNAIVRFDSTTGKLGQNSTVIVDDTGNISPTVNDAAGLGTATLSWADLFLASGSLINIANGNWVATHSSGILTVSTGDLRVTTAGTNSASVVTVGGTQTLTAKTITDGVNSVSAPGTTSIGYLGLPQNSQSAAYTTVMADAGKHILHPTADNNARTFTIDSNANVAYPIGTALTFINQINTVTIAITSDTLTLAGAGTTGSRTLAANGVATAVKIASTSWMISGTGLT
jgi:hypothetical protein